METIYLVCAGLDVHQKTVVACVRRRDAAGNTRSQTRTFGTTTGAVLQLRDWLRQSAVTHVAMESTGVYWKPIWNILEGLFQILLVNAQHIKQVPGRKTDVKDAEWIAQLLHHGLLRGSFVSCRAQRELRELTRQRRKLIQANASVANRIQKVLAGREREVGFGGDRRAGSVGPGHFGIDHRWRNGSGGLGGASRGQFASQVTRVAGGFAWVG